MHVLAAGCACMPGTQTSNDLSVETHTHTIRAPASTSLGNFLMTPSPGGDGIICR